MNRNNSTNNFIFFFKLVLIFGCTTYFTVGCKEISSSVSSYDSRLDSIFMGVKLGMERQAFYDHCWALNKSGQNITQGYHNTSVLVSDSTSFGYPVDINFYPNFNKDNLIYELPVRYEYRAWAPWNKEVHSDILLPLVVEKLESQYGGPFTYKKLENGGEVWYKKDGPRIIIAFIQSDQYVLVKFENETYKDKI